MYNASMVDIVKQIEYWKRGAKEDFVVAGELVEKGRYRHGLFFMHLALEKLLKAQVCKRTGAIAPKIHNLIRLAELAQLEIPEEMRNSMAKLNEFNLEGRYPMVAPLSRSESDGYMATAVEIFEWLTKQL
jgi:HEPN domain-containing protein